MSTTAVVRGGRGFGEKSEGRDPDSCEGMAQSYAHYVCYGQKRLDRKICVIKERNDIITR